MITIYRVINFVLVLSPKLFSLYIWPSSNYFIIRLKKPVAM